MSDAQLQEKPPLPGKESNAAAVTEVLRTGNRDAIEAIVNQLSERLAELKHSDSNKSNKCSNNSSNDGVIKLGLSESVTNALSTSQLNSQSQQIQFLSTEDNKPVSRTRSLRVKSSNRARQGSVKRQNTRPVCAYCGTKLGQVSSTVTTSDVGYCCSDCEGILGTEDPADPLNPSVPSTTPMPGANGSESDASFMVFEAFEQQQQQQQQQYDPSSYFDADPTVSGPCTDANNDTDTDTCDACHGSLGDEYVNIQGRRFHVTHFVCHDCRIPLYALGGYLQDPMGEKYYCQRDYLQRFSPNCHACGVPITSGEMAIALGRTYHSDCYVCSICQSPFIGDVCYEHDGQPLCEWHWYIQNGLLCTECGAIIKGQCVVTRGRKYHQQCAEQKYGESAITLSEARRLVKTQKGSA